MYLHQLEVILVNHFKNLIKETLNSKVPKQYCKTKPILKDLEDRSKLTKNKSAFLTAVF